MTIYSEVTMINSLAAAATIATVPVYILGIALMVFSVVLTVLVLMQSGKDKGLGTLGGSSDTYFGKNSGNTRDRLLSKLTIAVSAIIVVLVLVLVILITRASLGL